MSDQYTIDSESLSSSGVSAGSSQPVAQEFQNGAATGASAEALDGVEDIDFLLEEIENKIAPLALA